MTFQTAKDAVQYIAAAPAISYEESFRLSRFCSSLLCSEKTEKEGRDIVIRVRDSWHKLNPQTKPIWNDLTEAAGLYPYVSPEELSIGSLLRYEYHKSRYLDGIYLHAEQQELSMQLQSERSVVVSAPTSFGKSLLIEEIIASRRYRQIVIIQPTLALLDETRKKLIRYRDHYKLVVSTGQLPSKVKGNIFLFTGERVMEYAHFPRVEFFVIDEFYKLSMQRDDDRAIPLNQAFHKLLKHTNAFYLLGPMIKSIPLSFSKRFDLAWYPTEFATVAVDEKSMEISKSVKAKDKKAQKKIQLFELLVQSSDQTLIYCSSPNKATSLGLEFVQYLRNHPLRTPIKKVQQNHDMVEWIAENVHQRWSLIESLEHGVGFHHGALPRHLGSSLVDAFNNGSIRFLFCTSTLIEGVNTSAKTVILYDKEKGTKPIDFFDYRNIAGRSGRMNQHFIGNVIRFEAQPAQMDLFVDIPLFNQKDAPIEILIGLDEKEVDASAKSRLHAFNALPDELKTVIRQNASIHVEGQLAIIAEIENNLTYYHRLLSWSQFPRYEQLATVLELAWNHLMKPGDNKADVRNAKQLAVLAMQYANLKNIPAMIREAVNQDFNISRYPEEQDRVNRMSFFILNVMRHWFDYKLPKWISVVSALQEYVFKKHKLPAGNYSYFAASVENGFLSPTLAALAEYGIPVSAIRKLHRFFSNELAPEENIARVKRLIAENSPVKLLPYEVKKIRDAT